MKVLFICNQNQNRSKTAEELFKNNFETRSAGLYNINPVNEEQLSWADIIYVMEEEQRHELSIRFPKQYLAKTILNLDIQDIYRYNSQELKQILKQKVNLLTEPILK